MKIILIVFSLLLTGCTKSLLASLHKDVEWNCQAFSSEYVLTSKYVFEGAIDIKKGYVQINGSDRIMTDFEFTGFDSVWRWGSKTETTYGNANRYYRMTAIIDPDGRGSIYDHVTKKEVARFNCRRVKT